MKIAIITAAWKRHHLFEFFCWYWREMAFQQSANMELLLYVATSEPETAAIARKYKFHVIESPNQPLHQKWNAIAQLAKADQPDYCLFVGSDDFCNAALLSFFVKLMHKGTDYIAPLDWYFLDVVTKKLLYWGGYMESYRKGEPCGAGRALSNRMMNRLDWQPWGSGNDRMLDTAFKVKKSGEEITREFFFIANTPGLMGLDIKTAVNMTPFKSWPNTMILEETQRFLLNHFDIPMICKMMNIEPGIPEPEIVIKKPLVLPKRVLRGRIY